MHSDTDTLPRVRNNKSHFPYLSWIYGIKQWDKGACVKLDENVDLCNSSLLLVPGCVFIHVGVGLHIYCIKVTPKGDPRPLQACTPSCFTSICSYMGFFLHCARLHCVHFLNSHPLSPQRKFPLLIPPQSRTHLQSYSCWLVMCRGGSDRK